MANKVDGEPNLYNPDKIFDPPLFNSINKTDCFIKSNPANDVYEEVDPDIHTNFFKLSLSKYYTSDDLPLDLISNTNNNLSIISLNCRSLIPKLNDIKCLINDISNLKIISVSETWLTDDTSNLASLKNFNFEGSNRSCKIGGGAGLFIFNDIKYKLRSDLCLKNNTFDWIAIEFSVNQPTSCKKKKIIIYSIYRPPNTDINFFIEHLNSSFNRIKSLHKYNIYLTGDFNVDLLKNDNYNIKNIFQNFLLSYSFSPLINAPTRVSNLTATLIDNIFHNSFSKHSSGIIYCDISDHLPIFTVCENSVVAADMGSLTLRSLRPVNINSLNKTLAENDWSEFYLDYNLDRCLKNFLTVYNQSVNITCPFRSKRPIKSKNPWLTKGILKSSRTKNNLYKKFVKCPNEFNYSNYKLYRNKFNKLLKISEKNYYSNLFKKNISNSKKIWQGINDIINTNLVNDNISEILHNNHILSQPQDICEAFNNYFSSCCPISDIQSDKKNEIPLFYSNNYSKSFYFEDVDEHEVIECINNMKNSHSSGHDGLSAFLLKISIKNISQPLAHLFNLSFRTGVFPDHFKLAKVIPIYKNGDKHLISNYRPISLLPTLSKIMEKLMLKRLQSYLTKINYLSNSQYGFRKNCTTELALLHIVNNVMNNMEVKNITIGLFLDLSKAFDSINHDILLKKLNHIGIRGTMYDWFVSYLKGRRQFVSIGDDISSIQPNHLGVPQGSVLGPLLFSIFINDLPDSCKLLKTILFADDATFLCSGKNIDEATCIMNSELEKIYSWLNLNKLSLNYKKTHYMIFGPKILTNTINTSIFINNISIARVSMVSFLGFKLADNLSWLEHIKFISCKVSKITGILFKIRKKIPFNIMKKIYYSLIYPYLSYGVIIWGNSPQSHMSNLIKSYNNFIRCLFLLNKYDHISQYYRYGNLMTINLIYKLFSLKFMFKVYNKTIPSHFLQYFILSKQNSFSLRHNETYKEFFPRLHIFKSSIFSTGVSLWNNLPLNLKCLNNLKLFNKKIKLYLWLI